MLAICTFFSISAVSFIFSPLLYPSPSPDSQASYLLSQRTIYVAVLSISLISSACFTLKRILLDTFFLNPSDNSRAFTFYWYSLKWHCNLCPSIKVTVHNLEMSSLLPSDLSFSFLISRFLHEKSSLFIFKSVAGTLDFQFCHLSLSHRKCSLLASLGHLTQALGLCYPAHSVLLSTSGAYDSQGLGVNAIVTQWVHSKNQEISTQSCTMLLFHSLMTFHSMNVVLSSSRNLML